MQVHKPALITQATKVGTLRGNSPGSVQLQRAETMLKTMQTNFISNLIDPNGEEAIEIKNRIIELTSTDKDA